MRIWPIRSKAVRGCTIATAIVLASLGASSAPALADTSGPSADSLAIMGVNGGDLGYIRQNARFYVCAVNVQDPDGVKSVTMNVSAFGLPWPGIDLTKYPMSSAPYKTSTCPGGAYANNWEADWPSKLVLPEGSYPYSVTMTDSLGNTSNQSATVTVDNTPPRALDVQSANGGATIGKPEQGDSVVFSYSEPLQTWIAPPGGRNVVVHIDNNGSNDVLSVWSAGNTHNDGYEGTVALGGDYVSANATFGATGTPSTIAQSPTDPTKVVVTLGTPSGTTKTVTGTHKMVWTAGTGAFDRAGNHVVAGTVTQSGAGGPAF